MTINNIVVSGFCPVQAEGEHNGTKYYFRARHKRWCISFDEIEPLDVACGLREGFQLEGTYDNAGYMDTDVARNIVKFACELYDNNGKTYDDRSNVSAGS